MAQSLATPDVSQKGKLSTFSSFINMPCENLCHFSFNKNFLQRCNTITLMKEKNTIFVKYL